MAAWRYKISLLVLKKYFTRSLRSSLMKFFSTLEEKFRISARPCNILYISFNLVLMVLSYPSLLRDGGVDRRTLGTRLHLSDIAFNQIVAFRDGDIIIYLFIISIM